MGDNAKRPTIARIWRGRTRRERAHEYEAYSYEAGIKPLIEKALGVQTLREDRTDETEFVTISYWESVEAMSRFTGGEPTRIHHLARDPELLIELPQHVQIMRIRAWHGSTGGDDSMTHNKRTVESYMDGFRKTDRRLILSCLTDDVEWQIPGAFHVRGKEEFDNHIVDESFVANPAITITRLTEGDDVVVAEGSVRTQRKDGTFLNLAFCDVFEMQGGKIRRLISYLMETK